MYYHLFVLDVQSHHLCPKTVKELLQGLSLILPYVKKIVRNGRGSPIRDVLFSEQLNELWERRHVAFKETDEPIHRCSHQSAHEQLASHHVRAPNQHHLRMESRQMSLWVLHTGKSDFGPYERGWYHCIHDLLRERHRELSGRRRRFLIFLLTFACLFCRSLRNSSFNRCSSSFVARNAAKSAWMRL